MWRYFISVILSYKANTSEYVTKETLEGLGDFKIGGQIIHTVKYADELVLLAKEEKVLQDMIDKLTEIGRCYGMEINVEKTKLMRISRQPLPVKIMIDQKQLENVESFKYLCGHLSHGICTSYLFIRPEYRLYLARGRKLHSD
jgi:hypothetical protein